MSTTIHTTSAAAPPTGLNGFTLTQLVQAVKHALGGTPDPKTTAEEIVNDAIQWLANFHTWTWRQAPLSLDLAEDEDYVLLPADFQELESIEWGANQSTRWALRPTTLASIHGFRSSTTQIGFGGSLYYAIGFRAQAAASTLPLARLELWPTPTADADAALVGTYRRAIRTLVGNNDYPDIPVQFHGVLKRLCRAMAVSDEEAQAGEDWRRVLDELPRLVNSDGSRQPSLGQMRGAVQYAEPYVSMSLAPGQIIAP